jgi:excisionase family DNA binding protein
MASQTAPSAPAVDKLLAAKEVAAQLGVSVNTIRRWTATGHLPAVRLTPLSPLRFRRRDVEALIERGAKADR